MADDENQRGENHLQAWRLFRKLTQEELAAKLSPPTTGSVISLLESGARKLSPKWLRKLAPALGTSPGYLLDHHPDDVPVEFLEVIADIPESRQAQALAILRTFTRNGTEG